MPVRMARIAVARSPDMVSVPVVVCQAPNVPLGLLQPTVYVVSFPAAQMSIAPERSNVPLQLALFNQQPAGFMLGQLTAADAF